MPPTSAASSSPPNSLPLTVTPSESMAMIGNLPCASSDGLILTPSIEPENSRPGIPLIPVTLADSVRTKSSGWFSMSSHWMPIASIRIGRNDGHVKASPVAEPTPRKTPKPVFALNVPSPRKAKLRASPPSSSEPILTFAPTDERDELLRRARAGVEHEVARGQRDERRELDLERVDVELERVDLAVRGTSAARRSASSFGVPSGLRSSAVGAVGDRGGERLPGKSFAPPEAT